MDINEFCQLVFNENFEAVKENIQNVKDINQRDDEGQTALANAIECWNLSMIQLLLEHGADVNQRVRWPAYPIHLAIIADKEYYEDEVLKYHPDFGSDLDKAIDETVLETRFTGLILSYHPRLDVRDRFDRLPHEIYPTMTEFQNLLKKEAQWQKENNYDPE